MRTEEKSNGWVGSAAYFLVRCTTGGVARYFIKRLDNGHRLDASVKRTVSRDGLPATVFVAEGLATAKAVSAAWDDAPVLIAFDAGNLAATVAAARERYPQADLVIAADADAGRKTEGRGRIRPGVGQTKARERRRGTARG